MESQPQNPEFRNNPENFHPCVEMLKTWVVKFFKIPQWYFLTQPSGGRKFVSLYNI